MEALWKALKVGAAALLFAGVIYVLLAAPGLVEESASTAFLALEQVAGR